MSILVFAENWDGKFKKSTYEAISYGTEIAKQTNSTVTALVTGKGSEDDMKSLGNYGAQKGSSVENDQLKSMNPSAYASAIQQAAQKESAKVVILSYVFRQISRREGSNKIKGRINCRSLCSTFFHFTFYST